ncbi:MAG: hypothetical protein Ct9H90mP20_7550 [Candidatus Neomarinimicrobiota bacterium]|nr:MAG: hypothetical protein Ct9H90mP20_7550 [Candidatus Neomarinimicrobiota bacterium]
MCGGGLDNFWRSYGDCSYKVRFSRMIKEVTAESQGDWAFPRLWPITIKFIAPFVGIVLVGWGMIESPSFFLTCLVQWGLVLVIFFLINKLKIIKKITENLDAF